MGELVDDLAANKIREQARDLYKLKISLPLGNKNLKYVHTNQFLWTEFPEDTFKLENWPAIAAALDGDATSHSGYIKNRWFIESCTITNDGNNAKMELELNPFGTNQDTYLRDYESFTQAYEDAHNQNNENEDGNTPSVTGDNNSLAGGEPDFINEKVAQIVGNQTNALKKGKLIHAWLRDNKNLRYPKGGYNCKKWSTIKKCWDHKTNPGLNCADTAQLTVSMFRSAGIDCFVAHSPSHFYTVFYDDNGNMHCSDATGDRGIDHYWTPSNRNVKFRGKSSYYKNEGRTPECKHRNYN